MKLFHMNEKRILLLLSVYFFVNGILCKEEQNNKGIKNMEIKKTKFIEIMKDLKKEKQHHQYLKDYINVNYGDEGCIQIINDYIEFFSLPYMNCITSQYDFNCNNTVCIQLLVRLKQRLQPCTNTKNVLIQTVRVMAQGQSLYCIIINQGNNTCFTGILNQYVPQSNIMIKNIASNLANSLAQTYKWNS